MFTYSPRYILWYVFSAAPPENSDIHKYPVKKIAKSDHTFHFMKRLNEEYIEFLFEDKIRSLGTSTFDAYIEKSNTTALIVVKNDTIIYEKYFNGYQRDDLFMALSMTKSYVSTLIGIAINEGYIKSVDEPITNYLPELIKRDPRFEQITLKHLAMMCSGIDRHKSTLKYKNMQFPLLWDGMAIAGGHPKLKQYLMNNLDVAYRPGTKYEYLDFNTELLGLILERAINKTALEYLEEKIWKPCGMEYPAFWMSNSEDSEFTKMSSGLFARPIDYAKYGRLYLESGNWEGIQIIPEKWIIESIREDDTFNKEDYYSAPSVWLNNTYYKYHWKGIVNPDSTINFSIGGSFGQNIFIAPHKDLIIVHCGTKQNYYGVEDLWDIERLIDNPFYKILQSEGLPQAVAFVDSLLVNNRNKIVSGRQLNTLGYRFLNEGKFDDAIAIFKLYVRAYPSSSNAYDSLGEAYMKNGQRELAIINYKISLELNPNNSNAKKMLRQLKKQY